MKAALRESFPSPYPSCSRRSVIFGIRAAAILEGLGVSDMFTVKSLGVTKKKSASRRRQEIDLETVKVASR